MALATTTLLFQQAWSTQAKPAQMITADLFQEPIEANFKFFFPSERHQFLKRGIQMNWKRAGHFEKQMNKKCLVILHPAYAAQGNVSNSGRKSPVSQCFNCSSL